MLQTWSVERTRQGLFDLPLGSCRLDAGRRRWKCAWRGDNQARAFTAPAMTAAASTSALCQFRRWYAPWPGLVRTSVRD